jgi:hypothetical protein
MRFLWGTNWIAAYYLEEIQSLNPEGPATGQLDQGFPWFSSVLEQMLSWCPNSTLPSQC